MLGAPTAIEPHVRDNGLRSVDSYNGASDQESCKLEYSQRVWDMRYKRIHPILYAAVADSKPTSLALYTIPEPRAGEIQQCCGLQVTNYLDRF